jgi:hypothetical protein
VWRSCPDEPAADCGRFRVPIDADHPEQGTLSLSVKRYTASGRESERLGVLVYNPGGPGLSAVNPLQGSWHRQDPRGNKPGVDAQFSLTTEQLAWPVATELGEHDYPQLLVSPYPDVVESLRGATDALALCPGGLPSQLEPEFAGQKEAWPVHRSVTGQRSFADIRGTGWADSPIWPAAEQALPHARPSTVADMHNHA